jgi:hypothetical protein
MAWPSIANPSSIKRRYLKRTDRTRFETGRPASKGVHTSSRYAWELTWAAMSDADLTSLLSAFDSDQGGTFSWTDPINSTAYTVEYDMDEVVHTHVPVDHWHVVVKLRQA